MHADRGTAPETSGDLGSQSSELDLLRARCWRQAGEIRALGDTISVLRGGAAALAVDNAELRIVIACIEDPVDVVHRDGARCAGRRRSAPSARCW